MSLALQTTWNRISARKVWNTAIFSTKELRLYLGLQLPLPSLLHRQMSAMLVKLKPIRQANLEVANLKSHLPKRQTIVSLILTETCPRTSQDLRLI